VMSFELDQETAIIGAVSVSVTAPESAIVMSLPQPPPAPPPQADRASAGPRLHPRQRMNNLVGFTSARRARF
jgi:hypothetical protein